MIINFSKFNFRRKFFTYFLDRDVNPLCAILALNEKPVYFVGDISPWCGKIKSVTLGIPAPGA